MRRSVLVMLAAAVCVLVLSLAFRGLDSQSDVVRYLQHRSQASETALDAPPDVPEGVLRTHLPILRVDTGGAAIPDARHDDVPEDGIPDGTTPVAPCTVESIGAEGAWHTERDTPEFSDRAQIRVRGNSSRLFDKKPYLLRFVTENGDGKNCPLLGMYAASEWVLHGPFLDRTLMRNYLCYSMAGQIMPYTPNCRYCELILNGEYQGVYLLTEAITKGDGRVELSEPGNNSPITGWLVRWDRAEKGDTLLDNFSFYTYRAGVSALDLRYPGRNTVTEERIRYVTADISRIEREIYATGSSDQIDVTAFAQYYLLNELFGNVDAGRFSTFLYKDVRGKVTPVVWDFNNACDNYIDYTYDESGFYMIDAPWFSGLLKDKAFVESVIRQYHALRRSLLSDEALSAFIRETDAYLGTAVDRNDAVWGYVYRANKVDDVNYLHPLERNYRSHEEAVKQLETWLTARGRWLDRHIDSLRQYCHPSKNAG